MITLAKGNATKILFEGSSLVKVLLSDGWVEKKEKPTKKEVENGKTSTAGNQPDIRSSAK